MAYLRPGLLVLGLLSVFSWTSLHAQNISDSITVGVVSLTLGMHFDQVQDAFDKHSGQYDLRISNSEDPASGFFNLSVWSRDRGEPKDLLATLAFRDKRLGWVHKRWTVGNVGESTALDVAMGFYGAIQSLLSGAAGPCRIDTDEQNRPDLQLRKALVKCGRRTIEVSIGTDPQRRINDAGVSEELEAEWMFPARPR